MTNDKPKFELRDWYNEEFYQQLATTIMLAYPSFDTTSFVQDVTANLATLSLNQRLRQTTTCCRAYLPQDYRKAVTILYDVVPHMPNSYVGLFMPDYVGLYGLDDFDFSMEALKYFTPYASSEFAIREFLKRDLEKTLTVMVAWSEDENQHVRRLASEGCRPRLPWSFRLEALLHDPTPVQPILENLKADPERYVQKSVANHLNDISKNHPSWMLQLVSAWDMSQTATAWIVKRAARTLIKQGDPDAFALFGFEATPEIIVSPLQLSTSNLNLGDTLTFEFTITSTKSTPQKLVIDYIVHYVKKAGHTTPKVFKLKELVVAPQAEITLSKKQHYKNFSTRTHYPGQHTIEIMVNGQSMVKAGFELVV